jgi:hypothetical protein
MKHITTKRIVLSLLSLGALVWIGGTVYIEWAVEYHSDGFSNPATCRAPFRTYAATWPLWGRMPDAMGAWIVNQSFKLCGV